MISIYLLLDCIFIHSYLTQYTEKTDFRLVELSQNCIFIKFRVSLCKKLHFCSNQMSVQVFGVTKSYGKQKALDGVSFSVAEGEVVGFLGPNGAGKSTMMKIATGYLRADEGRVEVCGLDVAKHQREVHQIIGYLPEHNPLYPDMYVREYLSMIAGIYHVEQPAKRVAEMIELTGLGSECHKQIGALSKGYRQRVGIAQALLPNPRVVILDEPTTGLDPNQLVEVRELIRRVGESRTVLLSTHIMQEVEAMCSRVIILDHGKLKAQGRAADIATDVNHGMTVEVQFDREVDWELITAAFGRSGVERLSRCEFRISSRGVADVRHDVFHFAVNNNLVLLRLVCVDSTLEQVFRRVTEAEN